MEVNDLQSARDLNFRVEHPNIDLYANFYLPSYSRDFNMPDINFPCKSSLNAPPPYQIGCLVLNNIGRILVTFRNLGKMM